jgi:hypothetical protein
MALRSRYMLQILSMLLKRYCNWQAIFRLRVKATERSLIAKLGIIEKSYESRCRIRGTNCGGQNQ